MGLGDSELKELEELLILNPQEGDVIQGTGGARKLRFQLEGRGKRGGAKVIYVDIFEKEKLYFLLHILKMYRKTLQANKKTS